jgi:uncharacterized phosphosugar-binding protein
MKSLDYIHAVQDVLQQIATEQIEAIHLAGCLVGTALANGGVVHTFGSGHSHMIAEEAFFRAGGLAPVNAILDERLLFLHGALESTEAERELGYAQTILSRENISSNDVAIVISNSGRNAVPIEMALGFHSRGVKVIAITNVRQSAASSSRHASGKRLFELADVVIDNCVPAGDAVLSLPGTPHKLGPASTVAGAAIINTIMIEAALYLQRKGHPVPVLLSANLETSSQKALEESLAPWKCRIRLMNIPPKDADAMKPAGEENAPGI